MVLGEVCTIQGFLQLFVDPLQIFFCVGVKYAYKLYIPAVTVASDNNLLGCGFVECKAGHGWEELGLNDRETADNVQRNG